MKKIIVSMLACLFMLSCADDSWKQELEEIKAELANQKQLIEALQQNSTITDIEQGDGQYTIKFSDGQAITLTNGKTPIITIGENGNWFIDGVDTGKPSKGEDGANGTDGENGEDGNDGSDGEDGTDGSNGSDGKTPTIEIGANGNWIINGTDTGIQAEGIDGEDAPYITSILNTENKLSFIFSDGTIIDCPLNNVSNISGKTFWTIFDSLGTGSTWQNKYVELTGAIFYPELNSSTSTPISIGGTSSGASHLNGTLNRAKNLVKYKDKYPIDIVFIENVNDISLNIGNINDEPWFQGRKIVCSQGAFKSSSEAINYARNNLNSILSNIPKELRKKGNMLTFPFYTSKEGINIKITNKAIKSGNITITVNNKKYYTTVDEKMNIYDIAYNISNIFFDGGWAYVNNGDASVTLSYYTNKPIIITFDDNETGVSAVINKEKATSEHIYYFKGYTENEWEDTNEWSTSISLYSSYKGLIEYLQKELPSTQLYWFIPSYWNVDFNDQTIKNPDGSFNLSLYMQTNNYIRWAELIKCQKNISKLYGIQVVDIHNNCGISLNNIDYYYYSSNVHPKKEGYYKWAETLYQLIN